MQKKRWSALSPKHLIVRMPNWLGDLVMAVPLLADLRRYYPNTEITAMCQSNVAPLLEKDPNVDEVFSFKKPSGWIHRIHHGVVVDHLRKGNYDLGILLTNSLSSAWWFWRGHVRNRIGYVGRWRRSLLDYAVPYPKNMEGQHLVETYKMLLQPLGVPRSERSPRLYVSEQELEAARDLLSRYGVTDKHIVVGINPGAAYGSAKCWLPGRFRKTTEWLLENPAIRVIYFGDNKGTPLINDICNAMPERVINLAGKTTLRELMSLIRLCSIFLTNDSGPMHIAAAVGTPLVALFGSTNDVKTGPYKTGVIINKCVPCSPCYKRICPTDFSCMKRIEVEDVCQAVQRILQRS